MGEVERDWDEQLFDWILQVENLAQVVREKYQLDALFRLRAQMIEKLYAVGGEWADRYKGMQDG
ncbi:MAG: hypothetical protein ACC700_19605 [Anaerolineales bacterium]